MSSVFVACVLLVISVLLAYKEIRSAISVAKEDAQEEGNDVLNRSDITEKREKSAIDPDDEVETKIKHQENHDQKHHEFTQNDIDDAIPMNQNPLSPEDEKVTANVKKDDAYRKLSSRDEDIRICPSNWTSSCKIDWWKPTCVTSQCNSPSWSQMPSRFITVTKMYFKDPWNIVDFLSNVMMYVSLVLLFSQDHRSTETILVTSITSGLLTIKFLSYLRGFDGTGWLITVLMQNMIDMSGFLIILFVIIAGFAVIFRSLLLNLEGECEIELLDNDGSGTTSFENDCNSPPFDSLGMSFYKVFNMAVLGDFENDYFDNSVSPWFSRLVFVVLVVVVTVIALNALIALLGDSYSRVQENITANKNMERAKLIVEYLSVIPETDRKRIENETKFIHILLPKHNLDESGHLDDGQQDDWEGSINATKKAIETSNSELQRRMDAKFKSLTESVQGMKKDNKALRQDLMTLMKQINSKLQSVTTPQNKLKNNQQKKKKNEDEDEDEDEHEHEDVDEDEDEDEDEDDDENEDEHKD